MEHENLKIISHPLLQHHLTSLRDERTSPAEFRNLLAEISRILVYEATRGLKTKATKISTPMESVSDAPVIADDLIVATVMRAGNGMLDAALRLLPFARAGHIGIYRDKFIRSTVEYFFRMPENTAGKSVLLLDPLLATGDTLISAVTRLKEYGVSEIRVVCLLIAPEGAERFFAKHPDVPVYCASLERELNEHGYILPGLGDAGDRLYGTHV